MAVTRSTLSDRARNPEHLPFGTVPGRGLERLLLIVTCLLIAGALTLTALARLVRMGDAVCTSESLKP